MDEPENGWDQCCRLVECLFDASARFDKDMEGEWHREIELPCGRSELYAEGEVCKQVARAAKLE